MTDRDEQTSQFTLHRKVSVWETTTIAADSVDEAVVVALRGEATDWQYVLETKNGTEFPDEIYVESDNGAMSLELKAADHARQNNLAVETCATYSGPVTLDQETELHLKPKARDFTRRHRDPANCAAPSRTTDSP